MDKETPLKPECSNTTSNPGMLLDHHHKYHGCGVAGHRCNRLSSGHIYIKHAINPILRAGSVG